MCLTVMSLDNSKHCHLEQILISYELLRYRYQGFTVFTPGILDKGKFVLIINTENMTDVLKRYLGSWSFHL